MNSIKIDNVDIELVNYYKCCGITFDSPLKYSFHIDLLSITLYIFLKTYPFST